MTGLFSVTSTYFTTMVLSKVMTMSRDRAAALSESATLGCVPGTGGGLARQVPAWRKGKIPKWWKVVAKGLFAEASCAGPVLAPSPKGKVFRGWEGRAGWANFKATEEDEGGNLLLFGERDGQAAAHMPEPLKKKVGAWYMAKAAPVKKKESGRKQRGIDVARQQWGAAPKAWGADTEPNPRTFCLIANAEGRVKHHQDLPYMEKHRTRTRAKVLGEIENLPKGAKLKIRPDAKRLKEVEEFGKRQGPTQ